MAEDDQALLREFAGNQAQDAFTALVRRHVNLVYSAALRQVRSPQLAEEVSQSVFLNLARNAAKLAPNIILTAWLYQVTRHAAIDVVRREASRQAREQIAFQMRELDDSPANWTEIEPLLDEAMESLDEADRSALLLRYFENKSLREVGVALGASEDAAQKRVSRALDRLREHFSSRKISIGASGLAALLSANAIQAAPVGLAGALATGAAAGLVLISPSVVSNTIAITMTATQKITVAALVAGAVAFGVYEANKASNLGSEVDLLRQQQRQVLNLSNQVQELTAERDRAQKQVAALVAENAAKTKAPADTLKLRGEVSKLRQEKTDLGATSGLSKVTANPEARKMMRDMQKLGMSAIYKDWAKSANLTSEQTEKLNDLLADHIMDNVENVTIALREKMSGDQLTQLFSAQEATLEAKVSELVGEEGLGKYREHTKNLLSSVSAEQFKSMMTGEKEAKDEKAKQMAQILAESAQGVLAGAGLPADYQLVPMLNFRNIASETEGERGLQLMDQVYASAESRLSSILDKDELTKFKEFRAQAISNNRGALSMNRGLMAPIGN